MTENREKHTNRLINESSPYLLQHAHNPVSWYPWCKEALEKAKNENKLILVSIGYAACHWCHVMEHESFEDPAVAAVMNKHFVCIKVDREERPDIDHVYMNAVQLINGNGGWPLNCFTLPDQRPVFGGTYFRKEQWIEILKALSGSFKADPGSFVRAAEEIEQGIVNSGLVSVKTGKENFSFDEIKDAVQKYKTYLDFELGGTRNAPKFPMPTALNFFMEYAWHAEDIDVQNYFSLTLRKMSQGGIYDQIGGGFARYSTDENWFAPHFEKMLYDNAQLVALYSRAYRQNNDPLYKKTVYQTCRFLERELRSPEYAFYSSLDADSEGEEGRFYVWTKEEIDTLTGENSQIFCRYFDITDNGNMGSGKNILHIDSTLPRISEDFDIDEKNISEILQNEIEKLLQNREKRARPALDDKILTSWNALMISAYCEAFTAFGDLSFLVKAKTSADFILQKQTSSDFRINRIYKNGKSTINGFLDDYALTIEAFIKLYQATNEESYLKTAGEFQEYLFSHFFNPLTSMFYYTSDTDPVIVSRRYEFDDNVIPSSNSVTARNLYLLGLFFYDDKYIKIAQQMTSNMKKNLLNSIGYFANWASLFLLFSKPPFEVVILGEEAFKFESDLKKRFRPDIIIAASSQKSELPVFKERFVEGKTVIYICRNHVCQLPVYSVEEALQFL